MGCHSSKLEDIQSPKSQQSPQLKIQSPTDITYKIDETPMSLNVEIDDDTLPEFIQTDELPDLPESNTQSPIHLQQQQHFQFPNETESPIITIDMIKKRNNDMIQTPYVGYDSDKIEISLLNIARKRVELLCPEPHYTYYISKIENTKSKKICQECQKHKSEHTPIEIVKKSKIIAVRMYKCDECENIPNNMIIPYDTEYIPSRHNGRQLCSSCYIKELRNKYHN